MEEKKKKVCIFTLYSKEGASSNFRILMFLNDLNNMFDVKTYSFWNKKYVNKYMGNKMKYIIPIAFQYFANVFRRFIQLLLIARNYDVVIFQKGVIPALPVSFVNYLQKNGVRVILDIDDAVYLSKHDYSDKIARKVDFVVVGNKYLMDHYVQLNSNIAIFPTVDYSPDYKSYIYNTFDEKCIGWIGSKATIKNLEVVVGAINKIVDRHPQVTTKIICNDDYGMQNKIKNSKFVPWTLTGYIKDMSDFTIGIMPLYDTPYNRGKCGFKLVQYMNLYKPIIASPVGVNKEIVGNCGLLASTEDEWVEAIELLLFNKSIYANCVKHMETDFESRYSYNRILEMWIQLINDRMNI